MIKYKFYIKIYEYIIHVAIEIKMLPISSKTYHEKLESVRILFEFSLESFAISSTLFKIT